MPEYINKLQVYNMHGEILQSFTPEKPVAEINLKSQPAGVYLVKMQTIYGVLSVKVIKK